MNEYMDGLLRFIGGVIVAVSMAAFMLACAFGIVWLVLNH